MRVHCTCYASIPMLKSMAFTTGLPEEVACDVKWVELATVATDKCYNLPCPLHLHVLDVPPIKIKCVANF